MLDGVLDNDTDLPIVSMPPIRSTLANFALFDLVGKQLSPGFATSARSPSTAPGPPNNSPPATRSPGRCLDA